MKKQYFFLIFIFSIFSLQGYSNSLIKCYNSITKSSLTVVPIFGSNASSYCQNSVAQPLPTISLNGISGVWSPSSVDTSLLGTTIYTFTPNIGQDATTASMFITVSPAANAGILSGVQNICVGLTTTFSSTITNGFWTSSDTSIASINALTGVITGQSAGTATITYTVTGVAPCLNATATRTVYVCSGTAPIITGNFSICLPGTSTTQLTGSGIPSAINPWVSLNPAVATINNSGLVTSVSYGATTITYTNNLNEITSVNVFVSTFPTITGDSSTCAGGTLQLSGSIFPNSTNPWTSSNTAIATVDNTGLVTGISAGTVNIIYKNLGGCTLSKMITINPFFAPIISVGVTTSNSITVDWAAVLGATNYTIVYSINGGAFVFGATGNILTYTRPGLSPGDTVDFCVTPTGLVGTCYTMGCGTYTTNSNCDGTNTPAAPEVIVVQPTCSVATGSINITGVSGQTYSLGGGPYTATTNYNGLAAGSTHTINTKNAIGCVSPSTLVTINNQSTTSNVNIFCDVPQFPNSVAFDWNPVQGFTSYDYIYSIDNQPSVSGTTMMSNFQVLDVLPGQSVAFSLLINEGICSGVFTATCGTLANTYFEKDAIQYFPNPVNDILNITNLKTTATIQILNAIGQQVFSKRITTKDTQIEMSTLTKGIYIVKVTSQKQAQTFKVIKS